jgi:predicted amidophosphoribosyltransferase
MLLPTRCPLCAIIGPAPCRSCAAVLVRAPAVPPIPWCTSVGACFRYDAAARSMMLAFKYRNRRDIVAFCAQALGRSAPAVDLVTWAPSTAPRVRARGFDQAEVLARAVARVLGVPVRASLRRVGTAHQTGLDAAARRRGPVFVPRPTRVRARRVLLVDDIVTTGSTLAHAAGALVAGGAPEVHARAVCWTAPPGGTAPVAALPGGARRPEEEERIVRPGGGAAPRVAS